VRINEGLEKKIKSKDKTPLIETENKIIDDANISFDLIFNRRHHSGWHCPTPREDNFNKFENYVIVEDPTRVSFIITQLIRTCNHYEREISVYDTSLNRWAKQIIVGKAPEGAWAGYPEMFACPKGGRCSLDFIDKILEKTKPFELKNISIPEQKYPKVKVI
jgi:hypothetical protein